MHIISSQATSRRRVHETLQLTTKTQVACKSSQTLSHISKEILEPCLMEACTLVRWNTKKQPKKLSSWWQIKHWKCDPGRKEKREIWGLEICWLEKALEFSAKELPCAWFLLCVWETVLGINGLQLNRIPTKKYLTPSAFFFLMETN